MTIDDLKVIKCLGEGIFGQVYLTTHKTKETLYAVKSISRNKITKYQIEENLQNEREILLKIDHP